DSLPAYVDGDARLEAFFTGWSVTEKTEDYQFKKGVNSWTQFVDGNTVKTIKLDHELETETEEQNTLSFEQDLFNGLKQVQKYR
ncbi:hypothetical protein NM952_12780, partial [Pasteurella multocida subsp. multocida]|nr:hypothetical protein [Pasteurella multocida]MDA5614380.1 hypothetical protein [Pasteurella multocida]MDA5619448.1 hypothetical protein [Pasteurella multocida subsp. multocida]MDA5621936.1 hypothetical protein [Pasteurella multocida subsp. multocida]MDA5624392.1 hypothetical protein [Pasteurella multocida]